MSTEVRITYFEPVCKPDSVLGGHLSGPDVTGRLKRLTRGTASNRIASYLALLRAEFTGFHYSTVTKRIAELRYGRTYFLLHWSSSETNSEWAGVTRCAALWSPDFPPAVTCVPASDYPTGSRVL